MSNYIWNENTVEYKQTKAPKKITGTRLASIFGLNPYTSEFACWADITHAYEFPFEENMFTHAGVTIEPKQARYIKENFYPSLVTPTEIYGENYFNKTHGDFFDDEHFGGMWDYIDSPNDKTCAVFEMKTAGAKKRELWSDNNIPEYYALQAALYAYLLNVDQVYMVATFLNWSDYSAPELFIPNSYNTIIVPFKLSERYPDFEDRYIKPAIEWWNKHIVTGISPVITEQDKELVKTMRREQMELEKDKITKLIEETSTKAQYLEEIVNNVVNGYTSALDVIMKEVCDNIVNVENPSTEILEKYFLELSNCIYFISERTERLGIYDGISKASAQEVYNKTYLEHQGSNVGVVGAKKPTVAESTAVAENETLYNNMVNEVYNRAYKIVKNKVDSAQTMISTISKVLSRRMSEAQLTSIQGNRRILNEETVY